MHCFLILDIIMTYFVCTLEFQSQYQLVLVIVFGLNQMNWLNLYKVDWYSIVCTKIELNSSKIDVWIGIVNIFSEGYSFKRDVSCFAKIIKISFWLTRSNESGRRIKQNVSRRMANETDDGNCPWKLFKCNCQYK